MKSKKSKTFVGSISVSEESVRDYLMMHVAYLNHTGYHLVFGTSQNELSILLEFIVSINLKKAK